MQNPSSDIRTAFDIGNVAAGLGLALSPWYLGYWAENPASWHALVVGGAIAALAVAAMLAFHKAEEWATLVLGVWAVLAPWTLGFAEVVTATTMHVLVGVIVAILASVSLWFTDNPPLSTA